jgi:hypothetical protein
LQDAAKIRVKLAQVKLGRMALCIPVASPIYVFQSQK